MAADTTTSSLESFFIGGILPPGAEPRTVNTDVGGGGGGGGGGDGGGGGGGTQRIDDQASPSINAVTLDHRRGMAASVCSLTPVPAFENNHMPGGL